MRRVQLNPNSTYNGIKGISPMIPFEHFDLSKCFSIDYMHAVLLGVTKNLLQLWTDTKNNRAPFYMTKPKRALLNTRLTQIKTPSFISRRPRLLHHLKYFKASEYRNLLLFYLPVCLKNLIEKKYVHHFRTLSWSIYKLLESKITRNDLNLGEKNLHDFVCDYEKYYGKVNMTMNVHSLLHLVLCARNSGPLYCYSMFPFESYNGVLKDFVVAPTDVLHQITTRYIGYKTLELNKDNVRIETITMKDETNVIFNDDHLKALEEADIEGAIRCFACVIQKGIKFTSMLYQKAKKTADFFVETDEGFGVVQFYFLDGSKHYAMIETLKVYKTVNQIKKVNFTNKFEIIQVKQIKDRCIYIKCRNKSYIATRPNCFERN